MATWAPLRELLSTVDDSTTLTWEQLDDLVGGLPPSAHQYPAFFAGDRPSWAGFRTRNVKLGEQVTFERVAGTSPAAKTRGARSLNEDGRHVGHQSDDDDLILRAAAATGISDRDSLVRQALETLIRVASARKLAAIGGSDAHAAAAPRRRGEAE
ncbi:MAG: type II toxin-antitoxin system VapB family antitoxin [Candidatus Nanopelagicales bacterium]|nr:type II toxin-antitoxin system VapB family antitoxin [Candidatus Nanopelagicales bacterium]